MVAIDISTPLDEVIELLTAEGHSRYPVYRERIEREFSIPFEQQPAMKALRLQGTQGAGITQPELVG